MICVGVGTALGRYTGRTICLGRRKQGGKASEEGRPTQIIEGLLDLLCHRSLVSKLFLSFLSHSDEQNQKSRDYGVWIY
jgi:hypothetical protein